MATLNAAISLHLAELDRQRIAIGENYNAFHDLLIPTRTDFDVYAIEARVNSGVAAKIASIAEPLSTAENKIQHQAYTLVDIAMTAAVAPGGIMDERINDGVNLAVLTVVDNIMNKVRPSVQETVDNIFVSYRDCVLSERSEAELALAAHWSLVKTGLQTSAGTIISDFQQFVDASTSVNITKLEEAVRTATTVFDVQRTSIVKSIDAAHRALGIRPPAIPHVHLAQSPCMILDPAAAVPPPPTGLKLLSDNVTPMGASRAAHASTAAYAPGDHTQHGDPRLPDRSLWTPPVNLYRPSDKQDPVICVGLLLTTPTHLILPRALAYVSTARVLDTMVGQTHPTTFVSPTFAATLSAIRPALAVRPDPLTPQTNTIAVSTVFLTIVKCQRYFLLTLDSKTRTS